MNELAIIQAAQTAVLLTVAGALIYAVVLLSRELRQAAAGMREMFRAQKELQDSIERIWRRIDEMEVANGLRIDFDQLERIRRLLDALEAAGKDKP
jgi:hypothetical protein